MSIQQFLLSFQLSVGILFSQSFSANENETKLTTIPLPEMEIPETIEPPVGGRMGDFHTPELVGSFNSPSTKTPMSVAWDGTYYYVSHGGNNDNVYRYDEQFNQVDYRYVAVDSRGIVQNPVDGKLYMKNYWNESFYRLNTDPFDGSVEYLYDLSGSSSQRKFTFSADGQYIFTPGNGQISKYDFNTGALVASITLEGNISGYGIAHTGEYLITSMGGEILGAYDEQGNFVGQSVFPEDIYSYYATPSYANGLCFTNNLANAIWKAWDIDDGFITTPGCTDPYANNYDASANEDDGSCAGYPDNGSYSLSFDGVDDYTSLDWSDQLSTYTVSMWVISNAAQQTNYDAFFSTHHPNTSGFQLDTDNGNSLRMLTPDFSMTFNEAIPTYWSHVAVVAETNGAVEKTTIYFNGDSVASVNDVESAWNKIDLGRNRMENSPGNWTVDEVSVWNTARTPAQIQSDMYNAHTGDEEGLLVYWKANAGTGTVLYDHTGNANHATINGATWSTETPILFQPQTTEELQAAVDLWVDDEATALATYGDISVWDVSLITDMSYLFQDKNTFNGNISAWDVSNVVDMEGMFYGALSFNIDLLSWDVSNVTNMSQMFFYAETFNGDLSDWDVSSVTNMAEMFMNAFVFNGDLSIWNISNVTDLSGMFTMSVSFTGDLSSWDVSNVTTLNSMFAFATSFNNDISSWNISNALNISSMFQDATVFNQDLSQWDISSVTEMNNVFYGNTNLSDENKCAIHSTWQSNNNWEYDWSANCELCEPNNLTGTSTTFGSVSLAWNEPGGCHNYVINELPFYDTGSNASATDDWPVSGSDDKDIAYKITLTETTTLDITTCNADTDFDTKLSIFDACDGQEIYYIDDNYINGACSYNGLWAYLVDVVLNPGTYYIVVDGYGGQVGNYGISVEESASNTNNNSMFTFERQMDQEIRKMEKDGFSDHEIDLAVNGDDHEQNNHSNVNSSRDIENYCGTFSGYSIYSSLTGNDPWDLVIQTGTADTTYIHTGLDDNTEYFYRVTTNYLEGESEPSMTISVTTPDPNQLVNGGFEIYTMHENSTQKLANGWGSWPSPDNPYYTIELDGAAIDNSASGIFSGYNGTNGLKMWNTCTDWDCVNYPSDYEHTIFQERTNMYAPGTQFTISAKVWHHADDVLEDGAKFELVAKYFGVGASGTMADPGEWWNNVVGIDRSEPFTNQDPFQTWTDRSVDGIVPAGTYRVELALMLTNAETGGHGAVYVDEVSLNVGSELAGVVFQPQNRDQLDIAINLWIIDNENALNIYGDINTWDVSLITDMTDLFVDKETFNGDISSWDVSNVTTMNYAFYGASSFSGDVSSWNVANVTNMDWMFGNATNFNSDLSLWDLSNVTSMVAIFSHTSFDQDISSWDVSNVTNMEAMFRESPFNKNISTWNVSSVTNMEQMFHHNSYFNQDISSWDVSNVTNMINLFDNCTLFNQDLSNWNVSSVTNMDGIFTNTDLSDINKCEIHTSWQENTNWPYDWEDVCGYVSCKPTNLMVSISENENVLSWIEPGGCEDYIVPSLPFYAIGNNSNAEDDWVVSAGEFQGHDVAYKLVLDEEKTLNISTCFPDTDFDTKLSVFSGCDGQELYYNDDPGVFDSDSESGMYETSECSIDGLFAMMHGVTLSAGTYYVVVDGFDGETGNYGLYLEESESAETNTERYTVENQIAQASEKLSKLGFSRIEINNFESRSLLSSSLQNRTNSRDIECGIVTTYRVYNSSDASLIAETSETTFTHTDLETGVDYCYSVSAVYPEGESRKTLPVCAEYFTPSSRSSLLAAVNLWGVDSLAATFAFGDIALWDVSSVTNMTNLFLDDTLFNSDISGWDISNVTDVSGMFKNAHSFNGNISSWDVSSVTNMTSMFENAESFAGDLSTWDVSNVTSMREMFTGAVSFQSDLSNWNVTSVTDMFRMFKLSSYNGDLSSWDVSSVENMQAMFNTNPVFSGDLSGWNVVSLINMHNMFVNASSFNSNISSWDVSNVTIMSNAFKNAESFNQNLSNWDIASVTVMEGVFNGQTGLSDTNKCFIDDAFQINVVWPYEWVGYCQPSLSGIADASILEDDTYTIDLEPFGVYLTSNEDVYSFSAYTDTFSVVVEMEGSNATIVPDPDWNGETQITAVVQNDLGDLSDETSFLLTVEPVDDVPFVDLYLTDSFLDEDFEDTVETDLNEVFKDIDGDLTFEFALSDENILGVAIVDEMLEFTSFQDVHGQTELVVTASNPMRASVSDTVMVTVLPVNDPPVVLVSSDTTYFDEDDVLSLPSIVEMMENGAWFDIDNSLEDLSFSLFSEIDFMHIDWDGENQSNAVLYADPDFYGEGAITLCVEDGEYQVCDSRVVMVSPVNDPPYFHGEMDALAGLNMEFHVPIHVEDIDSENLTLSFGDSFNVPNWIQISGNALHGMPDSLGHFPILLSVEDSDTSTLDTFHIHVENFSPVLTLVEDVPNDQGGRVYVHFERSFFDDLETTGQFYTVFRKDNVNDSLQWVGAGTVSATGQEFYATEVSTHGDSTINTDGVTEFKLVAFLEEGTFESEMMSGYSLDNLGPPAPTGVASHQSGLDIEISWNPMDIEDLNHFSVYRSDQSNFIPNEDHLLWQGSSHIFMDTTANWVIPYFYMIQATDYSGNSGEISEMIEENIHVEVNLTSPEDSAFFSITGEDVSNQGEVVFTWAVNEEIGQEGLENHFILSHENSGVLLDTVIMEHEFGVSYESILDFITMMGGNSLQADWAVHVTDGHDTLMSNEMRNVSFDASDVLSLDGVMLPLEFALGQNYPNPFNPSTKIQYALAKDGFVSVNIYDLMGRNIKSLINTGQVAGYYEINWNATNNNGEVVPAGMYFYMIRAGVFTSTKKMVLLK